MQMMLLGGHPDNFDILLQMRFSTFFLLLFIFALGIVLTNRSGFDSNNMCSHVHIITVATLVCVCVCLIFPKASHNGDVTWIHMRSL